MLFVFFSIAGALFLDTNDLTGAVPACLDSMTHLRQLYLFNNDLTGVLPEGLEGLTSLRKYLVNILSFTRVFAYLRVLRLHST